jgi:serine protease Do
VSGNRSSTRRRVRAASLLITLALVGAACGGGSDDIEIVGGEPTTPPATEATDGGGDTGGDETAPTEAPTGATEAPTEAPATGAITSFQDAQPAVIQVIAAGSFRDPETGSTFTGAGSGSGFIISADGIAVTNNHVVAGAATLEVFIGGDTAKSYNATVLGTSECNDLAVIDIAEEAPLPFLEWFADPISAGQDVYAAGFPLGDPQYTLTSGIVSKAQAAGDITGTSSIDRTIEHDANIQPGNSGGPLLSPDGRVVAVNYAGGAVATTTAQFYAIASDLAQPVVERLRSGDFESIGINGQGVFDEATGIAGVWVSAVDAGSPASAVGLLPGDIITSMNGLPVAQDGTFRDYCDVIRTAGTGAIAIEVLRFDSSEVYRGEINGAPLTLSFSFANAVEEEVDMAEPGTGGGAATYSGYQEVTDDSGQIRVQVPNEWTDINTAAFTFDDGTTAPQIAAATDIDAFNTGFDVPGMNFLLFDPVDSVDDVLAVFEQSSSCTDLGIQDYSDALYTGKFQIWDACGGTANAYVVLAAVPADNSFTAIITVNITSEADLEALDQIFSSFVAAPAG